MSVTWGCKSSHEAGGQPRGTCITPYIEEYECESKTVDDDLQEGLELEFGGNFRRLRGEVQVRGALR